ncbi:MAG: prolyl oligopeptidase family serine peptidase [Mangrovibacterium sp.]
MSNIDDNKGMTAKVINLVLGFLSFKKKRTLFFILFFCAQWVCAQYVHCFRDGYLLPLDLKYNREAPVRDLFAYNVPDGDFICHDPENFLFSTDSGDMKWIPVKGDTTGVFSGKSLMEGYLYLPYQSEREQTALLNVSGHSMLYLNGEPYAGDVYRRGNLDLPVKLKKGLNQIFVRCSERTKSQGIQARLLFPVAPVSLSTGDLTLPVIIAGKTPTLQAGALEVINGTGHFLSDLTITAILEGESVSDPVESVSPMTVRKVSFFFNAARVNQKGRYKCTVQLMQKGRKVDEKDIFIEAVDPGFSYSETFISNIDGSVQYYGITPQKGGIGKGASLFLSVHGAGVEAMGQARSYQSKNWGTIVTPTNRREYGFDWEDWGRLDALEVLEIAKAKLKPDLQRIYLTGHSMGGHGTWYLGATYPGQWAAIAPCAGYPVLKGYASSKETKPVKDLTAMEKMLERAGSHANVIELMPNYKESGIYIHHGDSDPVVPVGQARRMRELLGKFHQDFCYYEFPGGSHWFGNASVDWPPIFDYFKWHSIKPDTLVNGIDFITASPSISSSCYWASLLQQERSFQYSRLNLKVDRGKRIISGTTENASIISLLLNVFKSGDTITILLDNQPVFHVVNPGDKMIFLHKRDHWQEGEEPDPRQKGVARNGSFKEAFNHRVVFVYGTAGDAGENQANYAKARYDAQVWYYRGNGSVDILPDREFDPAKYPDRNIILYGNSSNNRSWNKLLADCPVQVKKGSVNLGGRQLRGDDLGAYFVWPREDSSVATVGVVAGSGIRGMKAAEANQYFISGSSFPDFMIFSADMLKDGIKGIKCAGFYDRDWHLDPDGMVFED